MGWTCISFNLCVIVSAIKYMTNKANYYLHKYYRNGQ